LFPSCYDDILNTTKCWMTSAVTCRICNLVPCSFSEEYSTEPLNLRFHSNIARFALFVNLLHIVVHINTQIFIYDLNALREFWYYFCAFSFAAARKDWTDGRTDERTDRRTAIPDEDVSLWCMKYWQDGRYHCLSRSVTCSRSYVTTRAALRLSSCHVLGSGQKYLSFKFGTLTAAKPEAMSNYRTSPEHNAARYTIWSAPEL
jgi:hypothetical protein